MILKDKYNESKNKSFFFKIDKNCLMIFQGKSSVDFNSCNCYLIRDEKEITLIDPGSSRHLLKKAIKMFNLDIKNVKNIILTHAHSDHYVLVDYLKKKADPQIYIHHKDKEFLENSNKYIDFLFELNFFRSRLKFKEFYEVLNYFSNPEEFKHINKKIELNSAIKNVFDAWKIYNIKPNNVYRNNEVLPNNLKVIHLPGHTPGHCGLLEKDRSIIFCADIDFNKRGPTVSSPFANIHDYKNSITNLIGIIKKLKIRFLYPAHWNPVFSNLIGNLKRFCNKFDEKQIKILNILGKKEKMTIDEITQETFKEFSKNFYDFLDDNNRDSLLVAEASDFMTNRNYLIELKRLNYVTNIFVKKQEYWEL